jgi:hypothetical protein
MPTNKNVLRSVEEFMNDYTPVYQPIYPLFMGKSQQYAQEAGKIDFKRVNAVGDIRAKHITPKDTEIRQVAVMEGSKTYKKYFLANQFQQSTLQDRKGIEEVMAQVLDEHQKHQDELFLLGEGTSGSDVKNNGLFYSGDANYTLESSAEIPTSGRLVDFHTKVVASAIAADQLAGQKIIVFYGNVLPLFRSLHEDAARAVRAVLQEALPSYRFVELPSAVTPASSNGWIVANLDQVKLHHTTLPSVQNQGLNEEKMYYWHNFLMGSMMLEVLASGAVIRQPTTLAA